MIDKKRQENIDAAMKNLYDYIDSLPEDRRAKALAYQAELNRRAGDSPTGMLEVCISEMKKVGNMFQALSKKAEKGLNKLTDKVLEAEAKKQYDYETDNHPTIHSNLFPAWEELSDEERSERINRLLK